MDITVILLILAAYFAGGIPSGYLSARAFKKIDIRKHGSGNPGAVNVYRVAGPAAGVITLIFDISKGFVPVFAAQRLFPEQETVFLLVGAAAIAGHLWMVFLRFDGGKGVATTAGVFLALLPKPMVPTLAVCAAGVVFSGHFSIGSIAGAAAFPFLALAFGAAPGRAGLAFLSCSLILFKHIPNLKRILRGQPVGAKPGS
ncbi:MAG: glycerol-3-phosphate 1-O-acyltransferase PlsY [Elusimicrobiota bacterium]